ncbi:MAG: polyprenyl synthetase family protein [Blautia sp.]|nr:polyprenyl synthetase family protein [Lachnoclostridium sp.]MCM1210691.1 polyprenyl synthetase family protein [Blautia sp.]
MNFEKQLEEKTAAIETMLQTFLPKAEGKQKRVIEAMRYAMTSGGKRLRPMLMAETFAMFGGSGKMIEPFMAAIEMIHNYSLVHDDLPAMDNDEFRRGRKTTHVVYGEGMAVLAGDALLNYAFETACLAFEEAQDKEAYQRAALALSILGRKAGVYGMIGGQCADIEAEDMPDKVTEELLLFIHEHKTAALIQCAMMIGAILAGADKEQIAAIEKCAYNIGVAFQIQDDILDVTGKQEVLGKPIGSDEKNNKITYVTIRGLQQSAQMVETLSKEAIAILASFPERNLFLEKLVEQLIYREK